MLCTSVVAKWFLQTSILEKKAEEFHTCRLHLMAVPFSDRRHCPCCGNLWDVRPLMHLFPLEEFQASFTASERVQDFLEVDSWVTEKCHSSVAWQLVCYWMLTDPWSRDYYQMVNRSWNSGLPPCNQVKYTLGYFFPLAFLRGSSNSVYFPLELKNSVWQPSAGVYFPNSASRSTQVWEREAPPKCQMGF